MRFLKPIVGIILIIVAIVGGYFWETQGRQNYQQIEMPVTSVDIQKGEKFNTQMLKTVYIDKSSMVNGALSQMDIRQIVDNRATQFIPANSQVVSSYFEENDTSFSDDMSVFSIPASWIFSRSSTLRKGDWVEIYGEDEDSYFGKYRVAFVKDQSEVEIENPEGPFIQKNILERTASTGVIHHIELYCTLRDYCNLFEYVMESGFGFLMVQREELL